jgi:hypothetical protein
VTAADELADRLASIAQQLAARVRDDDPEANQRWLHAVTTPEEREALLYVLAAAVPDDQTWTELVGWTGEPAGRRLRPHGTAAAAQRHRYRSEPLCGQCRAWDAARKRRTRLVALSSAGVDTVASTPPFDNEGTSTQADVA